MSYFSKLPTRDECEILKWLWIPKEDEKLVRKALRKAAKELFKKVQKDKFLKHWWDIEPESALIYCFKEFLKRK